MATVYLADDLKHDRRVAIKVLRPELAAVIGAERFLAEIKLTANLQHPHILPLFDSGIAQDAGGGPEDEAPKRRSAEYLFYVMPFIEGESLRDRLQREKQLPVEEAVRMTREVASALDYAHRHNVIHRDIKPENILLHDGQALVADFGIALAASKAGGSRMTETGMSLGTPHYMSPEQAMGEREITARSDVYALGCVLYELLTGDPPFTGSTAQAIVARVVTESPRSLTSQRHTIPPHLEAAVFTALEKLPADRFASAADFAAALANPGYATPSHTRASAAVVPHRGRDWRTIGLVAALAIVVAVAAVGWLRPRPSGPPIRYRVSLDGEPLTPSLVGRHLAIAPDGRTIVFSRDSSGRRHLWIKTPDRADAEPLTGTAGGMAPTFSPDGQWVAFVAEGRIRKVPRLGGPAVTIADSASTLVPTVAWLDNGTVLFNGARLDLRAVAQDGGLVRVVFSRESLPMSIYSIGAMPGGRTALLGLCSGFCTRARLLAVDLDAGSKRELGEDVLRAWSIGGDRVAFARRDGGVFFASFDPKALAFRAPPLPVLDGVHTVGAHTAMALAANGTLLFVPGTAAAGDGVPSQPVWVTRDGRVSPIDSGWSFGKAANGGMALSPDGRRLAIAARIAGSEDIWIKELDRGPLTRLTFEGTNIRPVWTDGGRSVLYLSRPDTSGSEDLKRRRADGTGSAELLFDAPRPIYEVVPLLDTTQFLVRFGTAPTRDLYLLRRSMGSADSALTPVLANDGYEEVSISLSPDQRWLAYASTESGRYEVYVRPFPDVNAGRWQISRDGGNEPLWSHSGRELFFRSAADELVSVAVGQGPGFTAGEQKALFPVKGMVSGVTNIAYDLAPDDRRFVFLREMGSGDSTAVGTTAILVQNWLAEVEARGPGSQ